MFYELQTSFSQQVQWPCNMFHGPSVSMKFVERTQHMHLGGPSVSMKFVERTSEQAKFVEREAQGCERVRLI